MIARGRTNDTPEIEAVASPRRARFGVLVLIAAHVVADVLIGRAARSSLGFREFWVYPFLAAGVTCGQAVLLAQFLLLARGWLSLRVLLAAGWFAMLYYLASPIFQSVGGPSAARFENLFPFALAFILSALMMLIHLAGGRRIQLRDADPNLADHEGFQFSLWQLFALTLAAAATLAVLRFARETFDQTSDALIFFWLCPLLHAFAALPLISPWAALGEEHPGRRCLTLVLLAIICGIGPVFIGKAPARTYGIFTGPLVLQSLIVIGTLLVARWLGYRFVSSKGQQLRRSRLFRVFAPPRESKRPRPRTS
jgi:hypothetical protein